MTVYKVPLIFLKKIKDATGVDQAVDQSLEDWASQFATLNPPARFQVQIKKGPDRRDPDGPPANQLAFFTCKPA